MTWTDFLQGGMALVMVLVFAVTILMPYLPGYLIVRWRLARWLRNGGQEVGYKAHHLARRPGKVSFGGREYRWLSDSCVLEEFIAAHAKSPVTYKGTGRLGESFGCVIEPGE